MPRLYGVWTRTACPWSSPHLSPAGTPWTQSQFKREEDFYYTEVQMKGKLLRLAAPQPTDSDPRRDQPAPHHPAPTPPPKPSPQARSPWPGVLPALQCSQQVSWLLLAHSGRPRTCQVWGPLGAQPRAVGIPVPVTGQPDHRATDHTRLERLSHSLVTHLLL